MEIFIVDRLKKCNKTADELQENLKTLRDLADGLENTHWGTTIGSLTGGVIGAVGGITSIFGAILAPFTMGASLIVTGVGLGVSLAGGATAGASNITSMVMESNGRQNITQLIKEIEEKFNSLVTWLKELENALKELKKNFESADNGNGVRPEKLVRLGVTVLKSTKGITKLVKIIKAVNIGRVAAQTARVTNIVFPTLFVAVDVFFIAVDAREIHHIREANDPNGQKIANVKSETMKFVMSIRKNANDLQKVLDELNEVTQLCKQYV